ncbi:MAG: hypothetical protein V1731_00135 [Candidatus Aenigmatarchaeota archaeon]
MRGQFFIISAVIIVAMLFAIYQSLQSYAEVDLSEPQRFSEYFTMKNIVDVSKKLAEELQSKKTCSQAEEYLENLKQSVENGHFPGRYSVDLEYAKICEPDSPSGMLRKVNFNIKLSSENIVIQKSFVAPGGYILNGDCDYKQWGVTGAIETGQVFDSSKLQYVCSNGPPGKFAWSKPDTYITIKDAAADLINMPVSVKAFTYQRRFTRDTDTFKVQISSDGASWSDCGTVTGINRESWVVEAACASFTGYDLYVKIIGVDLGSIENYMKRIEILYDATVIPPSNCPAYAPRYRGGAVPQTILGPSNCIPFGSSSYGTYKGFTYKNINPFTIAPGNYICFNLGAQNNIDITMSIDICHTTVNGGTVCDAGGYTNVVSSKTPVSPRGDTTCNTWELCYQAANSYSFPGGGMDVRVKAGGAFASDTTCDQVLCYGTATDPSNYFVRRWYSDGSGWDTGSIGSVIFCSSSTATTTTTTTTTSTTTTIAATGCSDGTEEQTVSANMVGCQKACNPSVILSESQLYRWNDYWKTACSSGWHLCSGAEATTNNNGCSGSWNNNYAIYASNLWTYYIGCGSGKSAAYTVTQSGSSCSYDNVLNGLYPAGTTDGIYGGFTAGPPTCSYYGNIGFGAHSHYPDACSMNFCNTCANGYGPQAGGSLCCKDA